MNNVNTTGHADRVTVRHTVGVAAALVLLIVPIGYVSQPGGRSRLTDYGLWMEKAADAGNPQSAIRNQ